VKPAILLHKNDHVAVALRHIKKGEIFSIEGVPAKVQLKEDIRKGHKFSIVPIKKGEEIWKYGYSIGVATEDIEQGAWVHIHNMQTGLSGILEYSYQPTAYASSIKQTNHSFRGYVRENGEVGIRNEIWIINTVGCINKSCEQLAKMANHKFSDQVDGVHHFSHPYGCSQLGDDLTYTQKLLASLANHPNAAGVLVMGLGCENNQIEEFKEVIGDQPSGRIKFLNAQTVDDEIEIGMDMIEQLVEYACQFTRVAVPVSKLKVGLKCGGSDGLSGITANPLVGALADLINSAQGTTIMTEVPEMFGAETILMNRAVDEEVFQKIVDLVNDFKAYFIRHNQEIYENPSPGNKNGGITTLEEKSLGCTQKGGNFQVQEVMRYGERVCKKGLNLLQAPGNDLISVTALAAAGAHIVLFTTGRGTPFGGPVPTMKISTNSELAMKKKNWIDFNAGELLEGKSLEMLSKELFREILDLASGEKMTKNEVFDFREISIFKDGVIL